MDVRYHYGHVVVAVYSTVVGLVVSRNLVTVDDVFAVEFVV